MNALQLIERERQRQIQREGFDAARDDAYAPGVLWAAAMSYVLAVEGERPPSFWPWSPEWFKPGSIERNLVKAGALILAERDRYHRAKDSRQVKLMNRRHAQIVRALDNVLDAAQQLLEATRSVTDAQFHTRAAADRLHVANELIGRLVAKS